MQPALPSRSTTERLVACARRGRGVLAGRLLGQAFDRRAGRAACGRATPPPDRRTGCAPSAAGPGLFCAMRSPAARRMARQTASRWSTPSRAMPSRSKPVENAQGQQELEPLAGRRRGVHCQTAIRGDPAGRARPAPPRPGPAWSGSRRAPAHARRRGGRARHDRNARGLRRRWFRGCAPARAGAARCPGGRGGCRDRPLASRRRTAAISASSRAWRRPAAGTPASRVAVARQRDRRREDFAAVSCGRGCVASSHQPARLPGVPQASGPRYSSSRRVNRPAGNCAGTRVEKSRQRTRFCGGDVAGGHADAGEARQRGLDHGERGGGGNGGVEGVAARGEQRRAGLGCQRVGSGNHAVQRGDRRTPAVHGGAQDPTGMGSRGPSAVARERAARGAGPGQSPGLAYLMSAPPAPQTTRPQKEWRRR